MAVGRCRPRQLAQREPRTLPAGRGSDLVDRLAEDDGATAIEEDAVFAVGADGAGEHQAFGIAADLQHVVDGVAVAHADGFLVDDGAVVEDLGGVVCGRANDFDAAVTSLVVRLGACESG